MQHNLRPATERELQRFVTEAAASAMPLEVAGYGTKAQVGRPSNTTTTLTTRSLSGLTLYEPTELVMGARTGTLLSRVESDLASHGQMLAFEPIDLGPVVGGAAGQATIGGVFATNLSGARRVMAGAARDHLLGIEAVAGTGQAFRSGGRVMKNVTGYDLCRAIAGSWGTLAVMTQTTFKVLPIPEQTATLILLGLEDSLAVEALCTALGTPYEVSGTVHLQEPLAERLWHAGLRAERKSVTAIRLENFSKSIAYRLPRLRHALQPYGEAHELDHASSTSFWDELRQLSVLQGNDWPLWRISVKPSAGPVVVKAIRGFMDCRAMYDWSGGLVWLEVLPSADAGATDIRRVIASHGGHATLIRAEPAVRSAVDVFQPLDPAVAEISRNLKSVFDPAGILNRGRMYAGF